MVESTLPASSHAKPFPRSTPSAALAPPATRMRILKFGGTSVATAARRAAVAEIVRRSHLVPAACRLRLRGPWHRRDLPRRVLAVLEDLGVRPYLVDPGLPGGTLEVVVAADAAARAEGMLADDGLVVDRHDVAVVATVGNRSGIAAETLRTLHDQDIEALALSGSAAATVAVVERSDGPRALTCLHDALVGGGSLLRPGRAASPRSQIAQVF
jgi:aspartokinase